MLKGEKNDRVGRDVRVQRRKGWQRKEERKKKGMKAEKIKKSRGEEMIEHTAWAGAVRREGEREDLDFLIMKKPQST